MSEPIESAPISVVDFLGNPINSNDTIIYAVRRGSKLWLKRLVVQAVRDTSAGVRVSGVNDFGRPVLIKNLKNTVVVTGVLPEGK